MMQPGSILLPGYHNTSDIRELGGDVDGSGPILRNAYGLFTYSVGFQMQGNLLTGAAAATPVDGSPRQHAKLDYTRYNFYGRSYGVGASVGLSDGSIHANPQNRNYSFVEPGLRTAVSCIVNKTSDFTITKSPYNEFFPDRILAIAAGKWYKHLDKIQCTLDFQPERLNVSVDINSRNITVIPLNLTNVEFDPGNLTQVTTRQFELIANDQTNLYTSLVGNSLNSSISDYITSQSPRKLSLEEASPFGVANAVEAMVDDMLLAYASAQLMISNQSESTNVTITGAAMRVGDDVYIRAAFGINLVVFILLIIEAVRTRLWHRLGTFDYMDPVDVILGALRKKERYNSSDTHAEVPWRKSKSIVALRSGTTLDIVQDGPRDYRPLAT
ncbi:hypothetical protein N0V90_003054 [Kalmusia sp. IMI 367209]|nr:hypothetical protein N0V90_003054 [Kalmusia sp. IMI 367209]